MPNIKSSKKSVKTIAKSTTRNTEYASRVKNSIKKLEKEIKEKNTEMMDNCLKTSIKNIDTAYSKGLIKKNTRDRQKSRLTQKVKGANK